MTVPSSGTCSESSENDQIKDHLLEEVKSTTTDFEKKRLKQLKWNMLLEYIKIILFSATFFTFSGGQNYSNEID